MAHSRYWASHDVVIMEPEWLILGIGSVMLLSPWTRNGSFSVSGQSCRCHHGSGMVHSESHASYAVSPSHPEWFIPWCKHGMLSACQTRNGYQANAMFSKGLVMFGMPNPEWISRELYENQCFTLVLLWFDDVGMPNPE